MANEPFYINGNEIVVAQKEKNLTTSISKVNQEYAHYWDSEYINQHLELINNPKERMLATFLWMTGIRITEAITLTKADIDFQNSTMNIRWLKSRKFRQRIVPIHSTLKVILAIYMAPLRMEQRLFPYTRQRAWQIIQKHFKGHPHQMRHSFAVNWLRNKGDIVILQKILGHTALQTTSEYLKIVPVDQSKELEKMTFR